MQTEQAFHWVINLLEKQSIAYKITGGLAARAHGVERPLADIDIDIARTDFERIIPAIQPYIVFGPAEYQDAHWHVYLITLRYLEQEIDVCDTEALLYNADTAQWQPYQSDLAVHVKAELFGRVVPIETCTNLIAYKSILKRAVDIEDVRQLHAREV